MGKKLTEERYRVLAGKRGFLFIGPMPSNTHAITEWECGLGHRWKAVYWNIKNGSNCPYCSGTAPKTAEDYFLMASRFDAAWLGPLPRNTDEKTVWECKNGHIWETSYGVIRGGSRCPECSGNRIKTENDYFILGKERGFAWKGDLLPQNTHTKTEWGCSSGHSFNSRYDDVRKGRGCPYCSRVVKKTEEDYLSVELEGQIRWAGTEFPKTTKVKTSWRCTKGHGWLATYNNVVIKGSGCPQCKNIINGARASRQQILIAEMVSGELNYWIGRKCVDIVLMEQRIAIEYNGWYWHKDKRKEDKIRTNELVEAGWKVIVVHGASDIPERGQMERAIQEVGKQTVIHIYLDDWQKLEKERGPNVS